MFFILITYFNFIIILYTHTHIQDINIQYMKSQGKCNFNYKKKNTKFDVQRCFSFCFFKLQRISVFNFHLSFLIKKYNIKIKYSNKYLIQPKI